MAIELVKKNYRQLKATAMLIDDRSVYMTGGKSLPDEENDRVVDILNRLLPRYQNKQVRLAKAIGLKQPSLSDILSRKKGAGNKAVSGIAKLLHVSEQDVRTGQVDLETVKKPLTTARSDQKQTGTSAEVHQKKIDDDSTDDEFIESLLPRSRYAHQLPAARYVLSDPDIKRYNKGLVRRTIASAVYYQSLGTEGDDLDFEGWIKKFWRMIRGAVNAEKSKISKPDTEVTDEDLIEAAKKELQELGLDDSDIS